MRRSMWEKRGGAVLLALGLATAMLSAAPASASFHDWDIEEAFSNADGTIQFIELYTDSLSQQFLNNHSIQVLGDAGVIATYVFIGDLGSGTAGRSFLIGTQGLADLPDGVTPDYIVPDDFIDVLLALSLNFGPNQDTFSLDGLPLDGLNSLDFAGETGAATPTNYAGEVGMVPEPTVALGHAVALMSVLLCARAAQRKPGPHS